MRGVYIALLLFATKVVGHVSHDISCSLTNEVGQCDGSANDTRVIQNMLAECCGNMLPVTILEGAICTSGPLDLPDHCVFEIQSGATLRALNRSEWPQPASGANVQNFISVQGRDNVTLSGGGVIDGQGAGWWPAKFAPKPEEGRPLLLFFDATDNVVIENLTLVNAAKFHVDICGGENYTVRYLTIRSPDYEIAPNTDGIDIAATNVHVYGCDVQNGDDSLCIKSPAHNVLVEDSVVSQGNGLVVGTANVANVSNITFRNIFANDTAFGCHIKFKPGQYGEVHDIRFENISIYQVASHSIPLNLFSAFLVTFFCL